MVGSSGWFDGREHGEEGDHGDDGEILEVHEGYLGCKLPEYYVDIMEKIGNPRSLMNRIQELITLVATAIEEKLSDKAEAHSYLLTSPSFEKLFLLKEPEKTEDITSRKAVLFQLLHDELTGDQKRPSSLREKPKEGEANCKMESTLLMFKRWRKLESDF